MNETFYQHAYTTVLIIILIPSLFDLLYRIFGDCIFIYDKNEIYSAFSSKNNEQPFILLRNQNSYYLPNYPMGSDWLKSDDKMYFPIVKSCRVKIVKVPKHEFTNAYSIRWFNKYTLYVPDNTEIYDKETALKLLKEGKFSDDLHFIKWWVKPKNN